jgi:chemotaxis signal transduction protein
LLVDEVRGVQRFESTQIEPPHVLGGDPPPHVAGVGRNDEAWCMLLDLRPVLEDRS